MPTREKKSTNFVSSHDARRPINGQNEWTPPVYSQLVRNMRTSSNQNLSNFKIKATAFSFRQKKKRIDDNNNSREAGQRKTWDNRNNVKKQDSFGAEENKSLETDVTLMMEKKGRGRKNS